MVVNDDRDVETKVRNFRNGTVAPVLRGSVTIER